MPRRSRLPRRDPSAQASAMVPMEIESAREKLLALAGFPLERRADIIRQAIETQVEALAATRPTKDGEATDWDARLRASDALEHLFGAVASRASTGAPGTTAVQIVVELPRYALAGQVVTQVIQPQQADQGYPEPVSSRPAAVKAAPEDDPEDF